MASRKGKIYRPMWLASFWTRRERSVRCPRAWHPLKLQEKPIKALRSIEKLLSWPSTRTLGWRAIYYFVGNEPAVEEDIKKDPHTRLKLFRDCGRHFILHTESTVRTVHILSASSRCNGINSNESSIINDSVRIFRTFFIRTSISFSVGSKESHWSMKNIVNKK